MSQIHIAALMMVKNEKKRLRVTLDSLIGYVSSIIVYDTGSTDNTIEILKEFERETKITLRLMEGEFVDFSTSRNVSLDFAATFEEVDYLLLIDVNDELQGGETMIQCAEHYKKSPDMGFMVCQQWLANNMITKYFNIRFIKNARMTVAGTNLVKSSWEFRGSVHEAIFYITDPNLEHTKMSDKFILYQDRMQDDDKTSKRFERDAKLLMEDHLKDPTNTRTLFYLAQTYSCLSQFEDSFHYFNLRTKYEGFQEENYISFYSLGELSLKLNRDWHECMTYYIKAFEHSARVEPLLRLAEYYRSEADRQVKNPKNSYEPYMSNNSWLLSYMYVNMACKLEFPDVLLFVNRLDYEYNRWHLMGIVSFYVGCHEEGIRACEKAYAVRGWEQDKINLEHHKNAIKHKFYDQETRKIKDNNPGLNQKQITKKLDMLWKLKNK